MSSLFSISLILVLLLGSGAARAGDAPGCKDTLEQLLDGSLTSRDFKIKEAPYNPMNEKDNCVACASAFLKNAFARKMIETAESMERNFRAAGIERRFDVPRALDYMQSATEGTASAQPVAFMAAKAPPGKYAIFYGNPETGEYHHVVVGWIKPDGRRFIYDPQIQQSWELKDVADWKALTRKYKAEGARPYLFTHPANE